MAGRNFDPDLREMMDEATALTPELEKDLENLVWLNRHFGSWRLVESFVSRWMPASGSWTVLDLATGSGDLPRRIVQIAKARGVDVQITAVDFQEPTLEAARKWNRDCPEIEFVRGNILQGWEPEPRDCVICSLALHHFSDADAVVILKNARRWSRGSVLVADLERTGWAKAAIFLITQVLLREPMTRYDARLSIDRAFSFAEMAAVAREAGWAGFGHQRFSTARQAVWLD